LKLYHNSPPNPSDRSAGIVVLEVCELASSWEGGLSSGLPLRVFTMEYPTLDAKARADVRTALLKRQSRYLRDVQNPGRKIALKQLYQPCHRKRFSPIRLPPSHQHHRLTTTMQYAPKVGDPISSLDTPSMLVDLNLMESNLTKLFSQLLPTGVAIRPHLKTTKSAVLAKRMAKAGAKGGCVAKLSEAEVLCRLGFTDLLITCEIIGAPKVQRLVELFKQYREIRIVVDSEEGASAIDRALTKAGIEEPIQTLIDLDVGLHRTGVQPGIPALQLARHIASLPNLKLIGIMGYEGHLQHIHSLEDRKKQCLDSMHTLTQTAASLRSHDFNIQVVTTGGTGTAEFCANVTGITEVQPGSFLFMDTDYRNAIGEGKFAQSLTILATVISKQGPHIVTIDAGLKSLTTDSGFAECKTPGYTYGVLGDEHGSLRWEEGKGKELKVGDRVEMVPSHIDPTVNLHDVYYAHRGGVVEEIWEVDSRGCVQ
jgi:D-serine deaminase-like pyridoxal phosphate-dependent protein